LFFDDIVHEFSKIMQKRAITEFGKIMQNKRSFKVTDIRIGTFSRNFWVFLEKRPLIIKFSKFCLESLHHDTDRRRGVQNSRKLSDGKSMKACVIYLTKKSFFSAPSQTVATAQIAHKVCHG